MKWPIVVQWVLIALTVLAMTNCIKQVVRMNADNTLAFEIAKDVIVLAGIVYLTRLSRTVRLAGVALVVLMAASFVGDWAVVMLAR